MSEETDFGDVSNFQKPSFTLPESEVSILAGIIIDTGFSAEDRIIEDIDDLAEVIDSEELKSIISNINAVPVEDLVINLLRSPGFFSVLNNRITMLVEVLNSLDYNE